MPDDNDNTTNQPDESNLAPSDDQGALNTQSIPGAPPTDSQNVPEQAADAGNDTNLPQDDSPETMDEAISQGDDSTGPDDPGPDDLPGTTGQGTL